MFSAPADLYDLIYSAFKDYGVEVIIVEPWCEPGQMEPGRVVVKQAASAEVAVCRMSRVTIEGSLSRLLFEYLIGRAEGIARASELHELGLFSRAEKLACFRAAGLEASYDPEGPYGRGLYVAPRNRTDG